MLKRQTIGSWQSINYQACKWQETSLQIPPPNCDPKVSLRLGLFLDDRLPGLAELSFGFQTAGYPYLGLMLLGPWARKHGNGKKFLKYIKICAQQSGCAELDLAVHDINPRGRAFWERGGVLATGNIRDIRIDDIHTKIHRLVKTL